MNWRSTNAVGASFILTNLAEDLSSLRLIRTSANYIPSPANNPEVAADVNDINTAIGFWRPQPDFRIAQRIAPGLEDFPDIEVEAADKALTDTFVKYQTDVLLRGITQNSDADLVLGYLEQPDGAEHQFLLTDPRQATDPSDPNSIEENQNQAKVDRFQDYVLNAYKVVSDAVQQVIDTVGVDDNGIPNSNIIITSDHGFAPFHTAVNMNNILANAGFDPNQVRAITSGPAVNIYINLAGREPNGTVELSEYKQLQQQIIDTLKGLQDTNGIYAPDGAVPLFDKVYERSVSDNPTVEEIVTASSEFIGQDTGDVFALLPIGYNFDGFQAEVQRQGDTALPEQDSIFSVPSFYGAHGYDPNLPEMQAIFMAAGPDFNTETLPDLEKIRSIDIAPTILDLLNVEPAPTVEGESIFAETPSNLKSTWNELEDNFLKLVGDNPDALTGIQDALVAAFNQLDDINLDTINTDALDDLFGNGDRLLDILFGSIGGKNLSFSDVLNLAQGSLNFENNQNIVGQLNQSLLSAPVPIV